MEPELGQIIAERSIEAIDKTGVKSNVRIKLGAPTAIPDGRDFFAPYQIEFRDKTRRWHAVGIDGFQALQLALKMIVVEIECIERDYEVTVGWGKDLI